MRSVSLNPSDGNLVLEFEAREEAAIQTLIFDITGGTILQESFETNSGSNRWKGTHSAVPEGT